MPPVIMIECWSSGTALLGETLCVIGLLQKGKSTDRSVTSEGISERAGRNNISHVLGRVHCTTGFK